jgi:four helix bundle protein
MSAKDFRDLLVWRKADQVTLGVYEITTAFPKHELYSLTSQMQRAAVSVPANIVEGFGRRSAPEKARFYNIAEASAAELQYYLLLSRKLKYWKGPSTVEDLLGEVRRMLHALVNSTLSGRLSRP